MAKRVVLESVEEAFSKKKIQPTWRMDLQCRIYQGKKRKN